MKKVLENLRKNKYFTLFFAIMLMFAYMGGARKYIYDNCTKIFDLSRMGSPWFNLSAGFAVLMAIAVCVGVLLAFLLRKKISIDWVIAGYGLGGVVSVLTLLFTPYNLQILSPSTQLDAFATVTFIAVFVFSLVTVVLLSAAISSHILIATHQTGMIAIIVSCAEIAIATLFICLSVAFNWSLQIYLIVLTALLLVFYTVNVFDKSGEEKLRLADIKINWLLVGIVIAVVVAAIISVLASSAVLVENAIKF